MINTGKEYISDWRKHIQIDEVREAFDYFLERADDSGLYRCKLRLKGVARDFCFEANGEQPFSFITNKKWLLFYFRPPAVNSGAYRKAKLREDFGEKFKDNPNNATEWTVRLQSRDDVERLLHHILGQSSQTHHQI